MNLSTLSLLRPWWLLLLLPLALLWWWSRRHGGVRADAWRTAVDAHLLPHLLIHGAEVRSRSARWVRWLLPLLVSLAVLALAGPSWRTLPVPLEQTEAPLVLAVDLSSSIRTADLKPSRLAQVRAKLRQLIAGREGGQLGLVVFADDAYSAAPITRDAHTLDNMLDALAPEVMPADGHRPDRAIASAADLLAKAGFQGGEILLLTDHADARAKTAAEQARARGFRVSALGLGTAAGAPLASARGFVTDANGQVRLARLDAPALTALATAGGGRYATLASDASDLQALGVLSANGSGVLRRGSEAGLDVQLSRSDDGYLLLPAVLLLGALAWWRRGDRLLALWPALALTLGAAIGPERALAQPAATPAVAPPTAETTPLPLWQRWWQRQDQQARAALEAGDATRARALATDAPTRGAAAFQASDFAAAAQAFDDPDDAEALYNRGTALARAGDYEEALKALDAALVKDPQAEDAAFNRQAILDFLERQKQQQQQQQQQSQEGEAQDSAPQAQAQEQAQSGDPQASQDPPAQSGEGESQAGQPGSQENAGSEDSAAQAQQPKPGAGEESPKPGAENDSAGADGAAGTAEAPDAQAQQEASEAAKQAMQQALESARQDPANTSADAGEAQAQTQPPATPPMSAAERSATEQQQALQQWLRRVPDDPGALLRRKFALEQQRRARAGTQRDDPSENPP